MSFNVYLQAGVLLDWVNMERLHAGRRKALGSFQDVLDQGSLYDILTDIDKDVFECFSEASPTKKVDILNQYMDREFGKRLKWSFKQSLSSPESQALSLTKLAVYFGIHSGGKNSYVNRILTLPEESQRTLMDLMGDLERDMENITEIRDIIEQIQGLEQENQQLRSKLAEMATVNQQMLGLLKDTEEENRGFREEIQKYRKEKNEVFAALQVSCMSQYLDEYRRLQAYYNTVLEALAMTEAQLHQAQQTSSSLSDRIKCDSLVISNLSDQISRLKQLQQQSDSLNGDWTGSSSNFNSSSKLSVLKSAASNKENFSKCSTQLGKSMEITGEWTAGEGEGLAGENELLRMQNKELTVSLQDMYKKYNTLNEQTSQLRQTNTKLNKSNTTLHRLLNEIEQEHYRFVAEYQSRQPIF